MLRILKLAWPASQKAKDISLPRNPILAKLFRMVKLAENVGFGLDKIEHNWKIYSSTVPVFQTEFDAVILDFNLKSSTQETSGKTSDKIVELIHNNNEISIPEMAEAIGVSERSIERNIQKLRMNNIIRRVGSAKGGSWEL